MIGCQGEILDYRIKLTQTIIWDTAKNINALLAGARGSGKSWLSMYIALKLAHLGDDTQAQAQIFIIDFKQSDTFKLKKFLPDGRVAGTKEEIFEVLEKFVSLMKERAKFITENAEFGSTAASLGMPLFYLWYDEFGAVTPTLDAKEKKKHDELLARIALLGRQYNFGLLAIMQQASVGNSGLNSNIKEQFGLICHMGQASKAAYKQTFGEGIEIPDIRLETGQGLLQLQGITRNGTVQPFSAPDLTGLKLWDEFEKAFSNQNDNGYLTKITE